MTEGQNMKCEGMKVDAIIRAKLKEI